MVSNGSRNIVALGGNMFDKIMFATSGTPVCDSPAKIAFDLAEREDAELLLFHVLGVPSRGFRDRKSVG